MRRFQERLTKPVAGLDGQSIEGAARVRSPMWPGERSLQHPNTVPLLVRPSRTESTGVRPGEDAVDVDCFASGIDEPASSALANVEPESGAGVELPDERPGHLTSSKLFFLKAKAQELPRAGQTCQAQGPKGHRKLSALLRRRLLELGSDRFKSRRTRRPRAWWPRTSSVTKAPSGRASRSGALRCRRNESSSMLFDALRLFK